METPTILVTYFCLNDRKMTDGQIAVRLDIAVDGESKFYENNSLVAFRCKEGEFLAIAKDATHLHKKVLEFAWEGDESDLEPD